MDVLTEEPFVPQVAAISGEDAMIQSYTVTINGVTLHYAKTELPARGAPLLFLHGLSGSHAEFLHLAPELAQQATVYFLDMRGHGLSSHTDTRYLVQHYAADVLAFLRTVVGEPAIIIGHSLGGLVATWLAAHHPEHLLGMVLVDPAFYVLQMQRFMESVFYAFFSDLRRYLREYHASGRSLEAMEKYVGEAPVDGSRTVLDVAGPDAVHDRALQLHQMDPATLDPVLAAVEPRLGPTLLGNAQPDELLEQIAIPVHLLSAQYNLGGALQERDVYRAVSHMPHCTYAIVKGAGHDIHLDQPEAFIREVSQFLSSIRQEVT